MTLILSNFPDDLSLHSPTKYSLTLPELSFSLDGRHFLADRFFTSSVVRKLVPVVTFVHFLSSNVLNPN